MSSADFITGDRVVYCGSFHKYLGKHGTVISVSPISCMVKFDDGVQFGVLSLVLEKVMSKEISKIPETAEAPTLYSSPSQSPLQSILQAALLKAISGAPGRTLREKVNILWMLGMRNQADIARVLSQDPDCWEGVTRERVRQILGDKVKEHRESLPKVGTCRDSDDAGKSLDVTIHLRLSGKQLQNYKTTAGAQGWPSLNRWIREVLDASSKVQSFGVDPLGVLREAIAKVEGG